MRVGGDNIRPLLHCILGGWPAESYSHSCGFHYHFCPHFCPKCSYSKQPVFAALWGELPPRLLKSSWSCLHQNTENWRLGISIALANDQGVVPFLWSGQLWGMIYTVYGADLRKWAKFSSVGPFLLISFIGPVVDALYWWLAGFLSFPVSPPQSPESFPSHLHTNPCVRIFL